jgi:hypothetical protein
MFLFYYNVKGLKGRDRLAQVETLTDFALSGHDVFGSTTVLKA